MDNWDGASTGLGVGGGSVGFGQGVHGDSLFEKGNHSGRAKFALDAIKTGASFGAIGGPIGAAAGSIIGIVADAVKDGISAYDTQKIVAGLKKLLQTLNANGPAQEKDLYKTLEYAITKKTSLRDRSIASATVVAKPFVGMHNAGKFVYKKVKGTQGVHREEYAQKLIQFAEGGGGASQKVQNVARQAVKLLCMQNFEEMMKNSVKEALRSS